MLDSYAPWQARGRRNCPSAGGSAVDQPGNNGRGEIEVGYVGDIRAHLDVGWSEWRMGIEEDAIYQHVERSARGGASRGAVTRSAAFERRQYHTRRTELACEAHWDILAEPAVDQLSTIDSDWLEDKRDGDTRTDGLREIAMIESHSPAGVKVRRDGAEWNGEGIEAPARDQVASHEQRSQKEIDGTLIGKARCDGEGSLFLSQQHEGRRLAGELAAKQRCP
jgi:hypothetical protein